MWFARKAMTTGTSLAWCRYQTALKIRYFRALFEERGIFRISLRPGLNLRKVIMPTETGPSPKQTGTEGITHVETCPSCKDPIYYRAAHCSRCGLRIERGSEA